MSDEKIKIPKTTVLPSDSKVTPTVTTSFVPGTSIQTYTFPAQEVPNTKKPKNVTFLNRVTGQMVTVDKNASANNKLLQAYGAGGNVQPVLYFAENALKGVTLKHNPKGMAAVVASRIAVSTLKYHYGTSQYGWLAAFGSAVGTNIKLSTLGYFKDAKVPKSVQKYFDKLTKLSYEFHHILEDKTYQPFQKSITIGKAKGQFNFLDLQFGANQIEAKYFNLKTAVGAVGSGVTTVKTMFGPGQSNGMFSNSTTENHPQNLIGSETHKNAKNASTLTNNVKVVNTAQIEVPIELAKRKIRGGKLTSNEKLLIDVRNKRKWVIVNAISQGKDSVEIAPKVYLDLKKYDAPKEIEQAVNYITIKKIESMRAKGLFTEKPKPMYGTPPMLGIGGTVSKIALAAGTIYEVGKQFYSIAEVWYKSNYGESEDEVKQQALAQQRINLIAAGGKEVINPDGSVTIILDITKQKQAVDNVLNKGQNVQMVIANKNFAAKKAKDAQANALFNVQSLNTALSKAKTIGQTNTGLGINTQRGPQTGIFGQNMGWTKGN